MKPTRYIVGMWVVPRVLKKKEVTAISKIVRLTFEELNLYIGATIYSCYYGNTLVFYAESSPLENLILPIQ